MLYNALKLLHVLSIIVWVGGMVFAHFFLRPAVQMLEPAQRLPLMMAVLQRFFLAVAVAVVVVLVTGLSIIGMVAIHSGGGGIAMPLDWSIMSALGSIMMVIFAYIYLGLFTQMEQAVGQENWAQAALALGKIRFWVSLNLALGVTVVGVTLLI